MPIGGYAPYDLVVHVGEKFFRVQVKTANEFTCDRQESAAVEAALAVKDLSEGDAGYEEKVDALGEAQDRLKRQEALVNRKVHSVGTHRVGGAAYTSEHADTIVTRAGNAWFLFPLTEEPFPKTVQVQLKPDEGADIKWNAYRDRWDLVGLGEVEEEDVEALEDKESDLELANRAVQEALERAWRGEEGAHDSECAGCGTPYETGVLDECPICGTPGPGFA